MGKIVVQDVNGQKQWCLNGKPLDRENVVVVRGGIEIVGIFACPGNGPPGEPELQYRIQGREDVETLRIDPQTDDVRRP